MSATPEYYFHDGQKLVATDNNNDGTKTPHVISSNIVTKFRDSGERYVPGEVYSEVKAVGSGDLIQSDGNAIASSWIDFSLDPLTAGTESSITTLSVFSMPIEVAVGLSMSQRTLGQEFAVEVISDEAAIPTEPDQTILNIQQATTTLTINFTDPHGLVPGKCFGVAGVSDSRLNYPSLVVATAPTPTQITATAGPGGNLPSVTAGPLTSGTVYFRSRLGYAQDGVSEIFENATATNASVYFRSDSGDSLPSGTVTTNHSLTIGTTASVQPINSVGVYAFQPTTEFRAVLQADRVQFSDSAMDTTAQSTNRLARMQVIPNPSKNYKLRVRGTNNKGLTTPIAQIVSITKTGTTTATVVLDRPVALTLADQIVGYGPRDAATNFPALAAATAITAIIDPTTIQVVWGPAVTAVSYGGYIARVNGGNLMSSLGGNAIAVQSAAVSTLPGGQRLLTLVGSGNWAGLVIGDYTNGVGIRNAVDGATLGIDGTYRVRNFATTTLELEPIGATVLPADFVAVNCGGAIIKRTSLRLHYVRLFDYERERVEVLARPSGDVASGVPVVLQGGSASVTATLTATTVSGNTAQDAAVPNPVAIGGRAANANQAAMSAAGDLVNTMHTMIGAVVEKPYAIPEAEWVFSAALTTTSDVVVQAAAGAGIKRHVTMLQATNTGASAVDVLLRDATTTRLQLTVPAGQSVAMPLPTGVTTTANAVLNVALSAAGTVRVNILGYTAP